MADDYPIPTVRFIGHQRFGTARWLGLSLPRDLRRLLLDGMLNARVAIQAAHGGEVGFHDTYYTSCCADNGHFALLQWARSLNAPWDTYTCAWAARNGHLDILQWAHANGAPWDGSVCENAASRGHLNVLKWARANGAPWTLMVYIYANCSGCKEVMEEVMDWVRQNEYPQ